MRCRVLTLLAWLLLVVAGSSTPSAQREAHNPFSQVQPQVISDYIVVLDAGSTATRAHAFKYERRVITPKSLDFVASKPLTFPEELFYVDRAPGISSFHQRRHDLYVYLTEIVQAVCDKLRTLDKHIRPSEVPVYLGATAGMRALSKETRDDVFEIVRDALRDGPLAFLRPQQARVLSGEEEAAYGWLMINHLFGEVSHDPNATFGSLDMGGDSAEVAFTPDDPSIMADLFPMHFGPFPGAIHVYAHSFMTYGLIAAFQRTSAHLLRGAGSPAELEHPCLPRSLKWRVEPGQFGVTTASTAQRSSGSLLLRGAGDFDRCASAAAAALSRQPCTLPPCSVLGEYQPSLGQVRFFVTGEFRNIYGILVPVAERAPGSRAIEVLQSRARAFCNASMAEQAETLAGAEASTAEPLLACWLAAWSVVFLTRGLGFPQNTTNILVDSSDGGASWSLGAAIYHVNFYPYRVLLGEAATKFESALANEVEQKRLKDAHELWLLRHGTHAKEDWKAVEKEEKRIRKDIKKEAKELKKLEERPICRPAGAEQAASPGAAAPAPAAQLAALLAAALVGAAAHAALRPRAAEPGAARRPLLGQQLCPSA